MYTKRLIIIILGIFFIHNTSYAQFELKIKSNHTYDSIAYLRGVIFDDKNFIPKDTIELYKEINTIKNTKPIIGGIYFLYFPKSKKKLFLTIENNDNISLSISDTQYINTVYTNNLKNDSFFSYQKLEQSLSNIDSSYELQLKQGRKFNLVQKATFFEEKNKQLIQKRIAIMKTIKPTTALWLYFDALNKLDASVPNKRKYEERTAFLNGININTPKIFFTPLLRPIVTEYLSYYPLQADSIIKGLDSIMLKLDCKGKAYPFVFDQLTKILNNREIQNNTNAYLYFLNKYVKDNKCKFLTPQIEKQYIDELDKIKELSKQDTSINIILKDSSGTTQNLHEYAKTQDLTLVTFYDPTCEHCKVELPKMDSIVSVLEKQLVLNIGKFTICNDMGNQPDVWKAFINEHHLNKNYVHVSLGNNNEIRKAYDAYSNPLFYLIDKDGKFIGKKISSNTLRKILINYIQSPK
jgi:hypothetical protein